MRTLLRSTTLPTLLLMAAAVSAPALHAQDGPDLEGQWSGALDVQGTTLRLLFNITATDDGYSTVIVSVDQGNAEIPTESTTLDGLDVIITVPQIPGGGEYLGTFTEDHTAIDGTWTQGPNSFPLLLERAETPDHESTRSPS